MCIVLCNVRMSVCVSVYLYVCLCVQVTLEGRAGALAAMHSLLQHCPELVTEDQIRRLLVPLEAAITMLNR